MISTSHSDTRLVTHLPACTSHSAPPSLFSPKPRATAAVNHPPAPLAPLPLPFHPPHSHTQPASPAPLRKPDASKRPAPSVGAAGAFLGPKAGGGARRRQAGTWRGAGRCGAACRRRSRRPTPSWGSPAWPSSSTRSGCSGPGPRRPPSYIAISPSPGTLHLLPLPLLSPTDLSCRLAENRRPPLPVPVLPPR
jgi:hypothetical protein